MRILTGDRPSGKLHLGHYVGSLKNRISFQEQPGVEQYILIADVQALTDDAARSKILKQNVNDIVLDYLSVGIDPYKSTFFLQSMIPEIAELTVFFLNLVTINRLRRNPTVKTESDQKNFGENMPAGFFVYPVSQAADILIFMATHVPVGEDQLPMIEQTNEIVRSFNRLYETNLFSEVQAVVPSVGRLMGVDGKAKMGKSLNNAIYLSDDADMVARKVKGMYTDPLHLKIEDPGNVEGNVVFSYLDIFDPHQEEVSELKAHYTKGGLADSVIKKRLVDVLNAFLDPIRQKRKIYENDSQSIAKFLHEGTARAQAIAKNSILQVKRAMGIDYF